MTDTEKTYYKCMIIKSESIIKQYESLIRICDRLKDETNLDLTHSTAKRLVRAFQSMIESENNYIDLMKNMIVANEA